MKKLMKFLTLVVTVFVLSFQPLVMQPVYAEKVACSARYMVRSGDTLNVIVKKYKGTTDLTAWDIMKANNTLIQRPNYPIYAGVPVCIPRNRGLQRVVSPAILNQPAAETIILRLGNKYTIYAWGWAKGSIWTVKINNPERKIGRLLITTKNRMSKEFTIVTRPTKFCFKNQQTDAAFCFPAPK